MIDESERMQACALCDSKLSVHSIVEGMHAFCCAGCHAVFGILTARGQLDHYEQHPIFIQALQAGLISNPALLDHIQQQRVDVKEGEREKLYLEIGEMWCPSCAQVIRLMLLKERGVINCVVDYATDLASIEFSPRHLSKESMIAVIKKLGYSPQTLDHNSRHAVSTDLYLRFGIAAFCSLNIMMLAYPLYATYFNYDGEGYGELFAWLSLFTSLPVLFYCAWPIWRRFLSGLKAGFLGMETLVAIGVWAAFGISVHELLSGGTQVYFDSMSVIIVFVLLGKIIESRAKFSAKESLMRLTRSTPRRGRKKFPGGTMQFVSVKEIAKGDVLVAYTGEKIALDGVVVEGRGACDESLMTGEAIPVVKQASSSVLGGTILVQGHLTYRVTNSSDETALHKIIQMVERDIGHKSIYVRAADRIVKWFVPLVVLIALFSALLYLVFPASGDFHPQETAWMRALAVLLISCPCAIGIAAPAAESYLLNGLAALGAIVRNRGCIPFLGREDVVIFDKTGTVTEGHFKVFSGVSGLSPVDKRALNSLSRHSMHPVACAIAEASVSDLQEVSALEEVVGYGLKGIVDSQCYFLGSARFMAMQGIAVPEQQGKDVGIYSAVYFAREQKYLGAIILGDQVREGVEEVVASMKPAQTILLSGDAEDPVAAVARFCQFDEWKSCCTPFEKKAFVDQQRQEGRVVCMLGDGINDAPALTAAHVGVSVVSASEMSIQVSDILLTTDRLSVLTSVRRLAVRGQRIVRQNLFWAFFYNVVGIMLAAFGVLSPIFAAFAMSVSSLTVLFNARRLSQ